MVERVRVSRPVTDLDGGARYPHSYSSSACEGFLALINETIRNRSVKGLKFTRGAPSISHLFFEDDSLFLAEADLRAAICLKRAIKIYEAALGQR